MTIKNPKTSSFHYNFRHFVSAIELKFDCSQDKLFPYAEENVKQFLENQWEDESVKEAIGALRKLALEDQEKSVEGVVAIPGEVLNLILVVFFNAFIKVCRKKGSA